ncbi:SCO3374 family protein [Streptomyces sp. NPDC086081]|uniref:SCO3374 family protein n=1 Tax=Streptomyces sp. NPDC086081 TaxID=3365749 RepID=UPI003820F44B
MSGALPSVTARTPAVVPPPRRSSARRWYEDGLGWPTAPGDPLRLVLGVRFDVLDVPAEAAPAALRRIGPRAPVAARGERVQLLVSAGSAEELPGLLEWLDWGALPLDLRALGAGAFLRAPLPPGTPPPEAGRACGPPAPGTPDAHAPAAADAASFSGAAAGLPTRAGVPVAGLPAGAGGPSAWGPEGPAPRGSGPDAGRPLPRGRLGSQGAAVWLRPPEPGCEVEASLPTLSALGGGGDAPDLVRLVDTVATQCHRARLRRAGAQPPASRARGR